MQVDHLLRTRGRGSGREPEVGDAPFGVDVGSVARGFMQPPLRVLFEWTDSPSGHCSEGTSVAEAPKVVDLDGERWGAFTR